MKGLIIKDPWITKILNNEKPWEIRGIDTKHRGHTELIKSGTGMRYGSGDLVGTKRLSRSDLFDNYDKHHILEFDDIPYRRIWAWVFENPVWHPEPIPYEHKQGCVIWVNI